MFGGSGVSLGVVGQRVCYNTTRGKGGRLASGVGSGCLAYMVKGVLVGWSMVCGVRSN